MNIRDVYTLALAQGLSHDQAVTATAIAISESGLNPSARGDTTLQDATWGPSIGLWQIRSLKSENGTGGTRDGSRLTDPAFNARSMAAISNGGRSWTPWSVYKSGAYRANLNTVIKATGANAVTTAGNVTTGGPGSYGNASTAGYDVDPLPGGGGLPGYGDDLLGGLGGGLGGAVGGKITDEIAKLAAGTILFTAALGLGAVLVIIGLGKAASA